MYLDYGEFWLQYSRIFCVLLVSTPLSSFPAPPLPLHDLHDVANVAAISPQPPAGRGGHSLRRIRAGDTSLAAIDSTLAELQRILS